ncbi:MAG: Uma2 family endonuclease [Isosphaeraceae bacterium]|nr:Uma2 family endonuclease [Isosphaeraceae bacterium]
MIKNTPHDYVVTQLGEAPRQVLNRAPRATDIGLLIEVADTTPVKDRGIKPRRYATVGIPSYWIVNRATRAVEVYRSPSDRGITAKYQDHRDFAEGQEVPVLIEGQEVGRLRVRDFLP